MRSIFIFLFTLLLPEAWCLDVTTTSGQLAAALAGHDGEIENLTVAGTVDQSDLDFVARQLGALKTLDFSGCAIDGAAIAAGTFAGSGLRAIVLPQQPLNIGDAAFMGAALQAVSLPQGCTVGSGAFAACPALAKVQLNGADLAAGYAFKDCKALEQVDFTGVRNVGEASFAACKALKTATGTASVAHIGPLAFAACAALQNFEFGTAVDSIGAFSFAASGLTAAATGPAAISDGAFFDCRGLAAFQAAEGLDSLPRYALKGAGIEGALTLPAGMLRIGDYGLKGAAKIEKVTLPASLESLGSHAMDGMTALSAIEAGDLAAVPATGNDVWQGVETSGVELAVAQEMKESFLGANQWQDFNVVISDRGSVRLPAAEDSGLSARVEGNTLTVETTAGIIGRIELYDLQGRLLAVFEPERPVFELSLEAVHAPVMMVRATTCINDNRQQGARATFKIYRHG